MPTLVWPAYQGSYSLKPLAFEVAAFSLLVLMAFRASWSQAKIGSFLRTGPNQAILLALAWSIVMGLYAPSPAQAVPQLLQLGAGVLLYFAVAYHLPERAQLQRLAGGLIGSVILGVGVACLSFAQQEGRSFAGAFGNPQLLASFLVLMLPLMVVMGQADRNDGRRVAAQFAATLALAALLLTQNRSAWLGAAAGLALLGALALRHFADRRGLMRRKHLILAPLVVVLVALVGFFVASGTGATFLARASTLGSLGSDPSFGWRLQSWGAAFQMFLERPLTGWGLGAFALLGSKFGAPALSSVVAAGMPPSMGEMAHNQYLQIMAETGMVGLILHALLLGSFFLYCGRALRRTESQTRKLVLMGAMAAVCAQAVDALGNPSYQFADVSLFFWLMLGLGVAAGRMQDERGAATEPARSAPLHPVRLPVRAVRLAAQAAVVSMAVLLMGEAYAQFPNTPPPGYREVTQCRLQPATTTLSVPVLGLPPNCHRFRFLVVFDLGNGLRQITDLTDDPGTAWSSDSACGGERNRGEYCVRGTAPNSCLGQFFTISARWSAGSSQSSCLDEATVQLRSARE
jgi:O-antigen ligase